MVITQKPRRDSESVSLKAASETCTSLSRPLSSSIFYQYSPMIASGESGEPVHTFLDSAERSQTG